MFQRRLCKAGQQLNNEQLSATFFSHFFLLEQHRKLIPPTKWSAEFNADITVPFFQWLVGPAELMEIEVNGVKQMSGVKFTKCRYLENSGCVGMCVNMCKIPTQDFLTNEFGLPLTMTPNFEDMSCEMFYGQLPPPIAEDPAQYVLGFYVETPFLVLESFVILLLRHIEV